MTYILSEPGFYDVEAEDYHADVAPEASLSNSIGQILLERCPRAAWWAHPRLNPQFQPEESTTFDRGTVAHAMLTGKGNFRIIDAADFRSKAAQMERDAYRAAGFTPILVGHHDQAQAMVRAARLQLPEIEGGAHAFNPEFGEFELCGLARDLTGSWARILIDFYGSRVPTGVVAWNYKTTSGSANPAQLRNQFNRLGWAFGAAFYERVITTLKPALAGKIAFKFLVQENEEPYLLSVIEPSAEARTIAHKQVAAAFAIWRACMERGAWPAYPRHSTPIGIHAGAEAAWLERELSDEMVQLAANDPYLCGLSAPSPNPSPPVSTLPPRVHALTDPDKMRRGPRGKYKPRKPKGEAGEPEALPPTQTLLDAG